MADENEETEVTDLLLPEKEQTETEATEITETKLKAPVIDYVALAAANAEAFKAAGIGALPKAEPKQLTAEEAKKLLNVWEPDDEFVAKFGNLDTQKAAIAQIRDAIVKQADTITQMRLAEMQEALEAKYGPIVQHVTEQQAATREAKFNTIYQDLAKPELVPLRDSIMHGLAGQGAFKGKSETDIFKLTADAMVAVIKQANPNFKLSPGGSTPTVKSTKPTIGSGLRPTTSGAGGGGGGSSSGDGRPLGVQLLRGK